MSKTKHVFYSYTIDDHPNPGACFDWMREHWDVADYVLDDTVASLKGFCNFYDIELTDWAISQSPDRGEHVTTSLSEGLEEMEGARLWKYLQNNYATYRSQYTSETARTVDGDCPFTGMCYDETLLDPIRAFLLKPASDTTWRMLVNECIDKLITEMHDECEYRNSDEALREDCEANDYEFDENGRPA